MKKKITLELTRTQALHLAATLNHAFTWASAGKVGKSAEQIHDMIYGQVGEQAWGSLPRPAHKAMRDADHRA